MHAPLPVRETKWVLEDRLTSSPYVLKDGPLTAIFRVKTFVDGVHRPEIRVVVPDMQAFTLPELLSMRDKGDHLWRGLTGEKIEAGIDAFRKAGHLAPHAAAPAVSDVPKAPARRLDLAA